MIEKSVKPFPGSTEKLADYIAGAQFEHLPPEVVRKVKYHILDTLGAMVSGIQLDCGSIVVEFVRAQGGKAESRVIGSNFKTSSILASFANGTLSHSDESDDVHPAQVHPGCASISSGMPLGECSKIDGKRFITAVVLGYEIAPRVIRSLDREQLRKRKHAETGISVCFGNTAVASKILGLDKGKVGSALGLAGQQVSSSTAIFHGPLHMAKAVDVGVAARNGTTSALLAQMGYVGTPAIFEGPASILDSFSGENYKVDELTKDLGDVFYLMDARIKKYPVGGPMQAPLECLFQIMREHRLQAKGISEIAVTIPETLAWVVRDRPIQDISFDYVLAAATCYGKLGWEEAHSESKWRQQEVQELRKKIKLIGSESLRIGCCNLAISTLGGERYSLDGDDASLSKIKQAEVEAKFLDLSAPLLGVENAEKVIALVDKLEKLDDLSKLANLLKSNR